MRYRFPRSDSLERGVIVSQVSSCTSAAGLNVLHLCAVECRRWLWVTVCTPPKNSSVSLQKSPSVFEGFSQVHMNFKVSMRFGVHGARVQRETLKTELHRLMFIEISLVFDSILVFGVINPGMDWCNYKILKRFNTYSRKKCTYRI